MIPLTLAEVTAAVDGRLLAADPAVRVTGSVEFDSRRVGPGALFVAFPGERVDGHDYAAAAVEAGAVAVLGTREVPGVPMVLVADALDAMGRLARAVVDRLPELTVIGLTGSSGKTTTKDLIAQLTVRLGPTVAPPGSFNNELGHPWTALQAGPETRFLVLEKGARGVGHVRYLCEVVPPRISVVLNVGVAHIGEFGSVENIALAKGELVESLPADGLAVLNADDPLVDAMAARTSARVVRYGEAAHADVRAVDVAMDERGRPSYTLVTPEGSAPVRLGLTGRHQVSNTLAAAAVARELGVPPAELATALGGLGLVSTRRMDVFDRPDGVTVIDDSYNANPASTGVALRALAGLGAGRRTVAVLGYMAELGSYEREGHLEVGRLAAELGVDRLLVVGEPAAPIHEGATAVEDWGGESVLLTDQAAAVEVLRSELRPGDVVLVKGSRYRTWEVADALRAEAAGNGAAS
ncbi:UDP-N-acetylmuramoyl-tripeptide--D-alanyl-D-alanine ligase [Micromonospora olivasterospora]|uniref:UDP-N-acetylmuramoyl-tripeptide--D-alanyl-D-alanine ligase n=1 Tax=Micromonospora olivasterospora TaxID=1880 RepID=A0A562I3Q0_MICOL|nr:UDP-N-acetylmuramoyl-tripeptide--D-alanyl-D-alanine ligase [Micromonospora olivasterospora]TWH65669.1 UDP-N-acetylmuramoyl-tripeptide--D-alanyl-D-alanine ligase [Micromonospora olivasterospora]